MLKASYMLTTAPAWALAFGYAVDRLPGRTRLVVAVDPGRLGARKSAVPAVLTAVTAVLFTCAGQRVDIVAAFRRAGATAVAADANPLAPALYHADQHALVPRVDDPDYIPALRALVEQHDVRLIVPLTDLDQVTLARSPRGARSRWCCSPTRRSSSGSSDKYLAHVLFEERGIASPPTWLPNGVPDDVAFPLLVKARHGFGSRHIYRAADRAQLGFFLGYTPVESIVQTCLGGEEFSIDVFCDLEGRCLNAIPRTMIESKGGESIKGMSDPRRRADRARRATSPRSSGSSGRRTSSASARPTGRTTSPTSTRASAAAFPLPLAAGGRYPELALALARGERPEPRLGDFREGIVMTRFFSDLSLTQNGDGTLKPLAPDRSEG